MPQGEELKNCGTIHYFMTANFVAAWADVELETPTALAAAPP